MDFNIWIASPYHLLVITSLVRKVRIVNIYFSSLAKSLKFENLEKKSSASQPPNHGFDVPKFGVWGHPQNIAMNKKKSSEKISVTWDVLKLTCGWKKNSKNHRFYIWVTSFHFSKFHLVGLQRCYNWSEQEYFTLWAKEDLLRLTCCWGAPRPFCHDPFWCEISSRASTWNRGCSSSSWSSISGCDFSRFILNRELKLIWFSEHSSSLNNDSRQCRWFQSTFIAGDWKGGDEKICKC